MREFKFRAWHIRGKKMIPNELLKNIRTSIELKNQEKVILMQYTGLQDKAGKDIYEGDLLLDRAYDKEAPNGKYYESKLPIFFENGAFWVDESYKKDRSSSCLLAEWEKPVVCGNIWSVK